MEVNVVYKPQVLEFVNDIIKNLNDRGYIHTSREEYDEYDFVELLGNGRELVEVELLPSNVHVYKEYYVYDCLSVIVAGELIETYVPFDGEVYVTLDTAVKMTDDFISNL